MLCHRAKGRKDSKESVAVSEAVKAPDERTGVRSGNAELVGDGNKGTFSAEVEMKARSAWGEELTGKNKEEIVSTENMFDMFNGKMHRNWAVSEKSVESTVVCLLSFFFFLTWAIGMIQ